MKESEYLIFTDGIFKTLEFWLYPNTNNANVVGIILSFFETFQGLEAFDKQTSEYIHWSELIDK